MSWADIFYPGNSEMKTRLAQLCGQLNTLLDSCFTAVNHLIDCVEEYLPGQKFEKITMQVSASLRDNCNLIIGRVNEIKNYLEKKEYEVEKLMGTELFNQLMNLDTKFQEKIDIAKKALIGIEGISLTVGGVALVAAIAAGKMLTKVVARLGVIATSTLATIGLAVFGLAIDMIVSAILGAVEKAELEKAVEEYANAVEAFKPAADEFYDNISMVRAMIKLHIKG